KGTDYPPYIEFCVHRDVGPDKLLVGCGKDIEGEGNCWLCDVKIPDLENSRSAQKREMARTIQRREQFLVQVSSYDPETQKFSLPKPWWVSTGSGIPGRQGRSLAITVQSLLASSKISYDDPIKGRNMNIERTGTGPRDTRYNVLPPDETPTKLPKSALSA